MAQYVQIYQDVHPPPPPPPPNAPLLPIQEPESSMEFISMDILYMPVDSEGYKFILVIGDLFSKYVEAMPLRDQSASTIMQALKDDWVLRYGCPTFLLSDQGSNADGKAIRELCETFNIKKRRSSAYHSQENGFAERSIRNIREMMRALLQDKKLPQTSWRQLLKEITFALNTSVSTATKVLYGKNAVLPIDVLMDTPSDLTTVSAYTSELKDRLANIYDEVRNNLHEMMKKQYDKKKNVNTYRLGDMLWLTNK